METKAGLAEAIYLSKYPLPMCSSPPAKARLDPFIRTTFVAQITLCPIGKAFLIYLQAFYKRTLLLPGAILAIIIRDLFSFSYSYSCPRWSLSSSALPGPIYGPEDDGSALAADHPYDAIVHKP
ncbi:hypothetical protein CISG_08552 [Coccidioides immitis RMSCC 3703]|uniref:Uncharacterized protein n=2 Tax=Coccidioides immitis TaxID=5501 RepID=A0A0J8R7N6_COCIT|nr:hypothetical protein CIRG_10211 [Coccidioides immitis RMSCC 2394]KMU80881.1 hypothetical protein CISG_08552 [Coccidioides immitis RMSCC 3703]